MTPARVTWAVTWIGGLAVCSEPAAGGAAFDAAMTGAANVAAPVRSSTRAIRWQVMCSIALVQAQAYLSFNTKKANAISAALNGMAR